MKEEKNNEPIISEEELKMPEEQFGEYEAPEPEGKSHLGMILGVLIVILTLLLAGLYLWGTNLNNTAPTPETASRPTAEENNEPESTRAEAQVETMQALSTSDEISAIEADLESTDLDELDTELTDIEAELEAAF